MSSAETIQARITERRATTSTGGVRLSIEVPGSYGFQAGQYLEVYHPDGTAIPLSIASAPALLPQLELHYQPTPDDPLSQAMDVCITHSALQLSEPLGEVRCPGVDQSLLVIAGGSGASLAFSCAQHRRHLDATAITHVLWCAERPEDFYAIAELASMADLHQVVDDRRGPENEALVKLPTLPAVDHYILAGSPGFVYAMTDKLTSMGVVATSLQSDVFAYAPRETPLRNT